MGTLNCAAVNVSGTAERGRDCHCRTEILPHSETTPSQKNVALPASVAKTKIYLPPVRIKLSLIKVFVKVMAKESEGFAY